MYEKFKLWLAFIFKNIVITEQQIVEHKYNELRKNIFRARTLNELMITYSELKALIRYVDQLGNPYWAKEKIQAATRHWNKRYQLWKSRG